MPHGVHDSFGSHEGPRLDGHLSIASVIGLAGLRNPRPIAEVSVVVREKSEGGERLLDYALGVSTPV